LNDKSFSSAPAPRQRKSLTDNRILDFPKHVPEKSLKQAKLSESNYYLVTIHLSASHYAITGAFTGGEVVLERELSRSSLQTPVHLRLICSP
jgi:hypothetical protein